MVAWLQANWVSVVAPLVVAVIDLLIAINPSLKANGILHQVYLWCGGKPPASS
jgi:hypothetical protein